MMKNVIQVYVLEPDRKKICDSAKKLRLSIGAFCRMILIQKANEILKSDIENEQRKKFNKRL